MGNTHRKRWFKSISYLLVLVILICSFSQSALAEIEKNLGQLPIGSLVYDANSIWEYKEGNNYSGTGDKKPVVWVVAAHNHDGYPKNSVTLLARETIAKYCFDDSLGVINGYLEGRNHWDESKLRAWLNKTFYEHLSPQFKDIILETELVSHKPVDGLAYTTQDRVFIPSCAELAYTKEMEVDYTNSNYADYSSTYTHESGSNWGFVKEDPNRQVWTSDVRYGVSASYWTRSTRSAVRDIFGVGTNGKFLKMRVPLPSVGVRPVINVDADSIVCSTHEGRWEIVGLADVGDNKQPTGLSTWAEDEVEAAIGYGLTTNNILSDYQRPITREEFCEMGVNLYEALTGKQASKPDNNPFMDTVNPQILKAYRLGIVSGISSAQFAPDAIVTREQIAVMFYRTLHAAAPDITEGNYTAVFNDKNLIADWAMESIAFMSSNGIIGGVGNQMFDPKGNATREQGIVLVTRTYEKFRLQ